MTRASLFVGTLLSLGLAATAQAAPPLTAHAAITVPGGPGGFDWMLVDRAHHRLYATHGGTKTLAVLDLSTGLPCGASRPGPFRASPWTRRGAGCSRAGTTTNSSSSTTRHSLRPARCR